MSECPEEAEGFEILITEIWPKLQNELCAEKCAEEKQFSQ